MSIQPPLGQTCHQVTGRRKTAEQIKASVEAWWSWGRQKAATRDTNLCGEAE